MRLDLFETNSGGLALVHRDTLTGYVGFEMGQNERRLQVSPRDEFTLASDGPDFENLGEGSDYTPISGDDVATLYNEQGEANAAVLVASWFSDADEHVTIYETNLGASARWYLDVEDR